MLNKMSFIFLITVILGNHSAFSMYGFQEGEKEILFGFQLKKISIPDQQRNNQFNIVIKDKQKQNITRDFKLIWAEGETVVDKIEDALTIRSHWSPFHNAWVFSHCFSNDIEIYDPNKKRIYGILFSIKEIKK